MNRLVASGVAIWTAIDPSRIAPSRIIIGTCARR